MPQGDNMNNNEFIVIGEHPIDPNDPGLLALLKQRKYAASSLGDPVSQLHEQELAVLNEDRPKKDV